MTSAESTTWPERSGVLGVIAGTGIVLAEIAAKPLTPMMGVAAFVVIMVAASGLQTWWISRPARTADRMLALLLSSVLGFVVLSLG
jgi:hypothetical protein